MDRTHHLLKTPVDDWHYFSSASAKQAKSTITTLCTGCRGTSIVVIMTHKTWQTTFVNDLLQAMNTNCTSTEEKTGNRVDLANPPARSQIVKPPKREQPLLHKTYTMRSIHILRKMLSARLGIR